MNDKRPAIKLDRNAKDRLLPHDFLDILTQRYLPVLSLTYVSSVIAIAAQKGDIVHYLFEDKSAYVLALLVAFWVSIPAMLWILLKNSHLHSHVADDWYKVSSCLMIIVLCMSYVLFPEANVYGLRIYFAATIPMLVILYYFFVKGGLPPLAAHPLTAVGMTFLIYGAVINFIH